jgi:hypothetical protein
MTLSAGAVIKNWRMKKVKIEICDICNNNIAEFNHDNKLICKACAVALLLDEMVNVKFIRIKKE